MPTPAIPIHEFDAEMATTRRVLERVPDAHGAWRPHPKSFPLGHLAQLVGWMPDWIAKTLREPAIDLAAQPGYDFRSIAAVLEAFDRNARAAHDALAGVTDDALDAPWSLTHGAHALMTLPRGEAVRQHLRHLVHHRGQLTVYLRLLDVPVPPVYGPTADERG